MALGFHWETVLAYIPDATAPSSSTLQRRAAPILASRSAADRVLPPPQGAQIGGRLIVRRVKRLNPISMSKTKVTIKTWQHAGLVGGQRYNDKQQML